MTTKRIMRIILAVSVGLAGGFFLWRAGAAAFRIDDLDAGSALALAVAAGLVFFAGIFFLGARSALRGASRSLGWLLVATAVTLIAVSPVGDDLGLWGAGLIAVWVIAVGAYVRRRDNAVTGRTDGPS